MPFMSFGQGLTKNMGTQLVPEDQKFPAGTLIPYFGNDPLIYGWSRYENADARALFGIASGGGGGLTLGTGKLPQQMQVRFNGYLASAGTHTGPTTYQRLYGTNGIYVDAKTQPGGTHTHTITGTTNISITGMLNTQKVTFLVATKSHDTLPVNSLIIKQTAAENTIAFSRPGSNFLIGANNDQTFTPGVPISGRPATPSVSTDGGHAHPGDQLGRKVINPGQRFYAYSMLSSPGAHNHSLSARTFSQSQIDHILVNLWQATAALRTSRDVIVPYVGLNNPPAPWVYCDGTNNTPDLRFKVIGYGENQWMVVKNHNATGTTNALTVSTVSITHDHTYSYYPADLVASSYPGIISNAQHTTYNWVHTHTANVSQSITPGMPGLLYVNFIQYKG